MEGEKASEEKNEAKGASKLDTVPKEELIKIVKAKMSALQKAKTHCEELIKELETCKQQNKSLTTEVNSLSKEKSEILIAYEGSQQSLDEAQQRLQNMETSIQKQTENEKAIKIQFNQLKKKNEELKEQLECLQLKNTTISQSYHDVEKETNSLRNLNKSLEEEVKVLTQARDEMVLKLKALKEKSNQKITCGKCENLQQKLQASQINANNLEAQLENSKEKNNLYESDLQSLKIELEKLNRDANSYKEKFEQSQESNNSLQLSIDQLQSLVETLADKCASGQRQLEELKLVEPVDQVAQCQVNEVSESKEEWTVQRDSYLAEIEKLNSQLQMKTEKESNEIQLKEEKDQLLENIESLKELVNALEKQKGELQNEKEKLLIDWEKWKEQLQNEKEKLMSDLDKQRNEKELLLSDFEKQKEELLNEKELLLSDFEKQKGELQNEKELLLLSAAEEIRRLKQLLKENDMDRENMQIQDNNEFVTKLAELADSLNKTMTEKEQMEARHAAELESLLEELAQLKTSKLSLEESASTEIDKNKFLLAEMEKIKEDLTEKEQKLVEWESLMHMLELERQQMQEVAAEFEQKDKQAMEDLDHLTSSFQEALSERDQLRDQICKMREERGSISGKLRQLKGVVGEMNFERDKLAKRVLILEESEQNANTRYESLKGELEELKTTNETSNSELNTAKNEIAKLLEERDKLQLDIMNLSKEKEENIVIASLRKENEEQWQQEIRQLTQQLQVENETLQKQSIVIESLQQENKRLQEDLQPANENHITNESNEQRKWYEKHQALERRITELLDEIKGMQNDKDVLLKDYQQLQVDLQTVILKEQDANTVKSRYKEKVELVEDEIKRLVVQKTESEKEMVEKLSKLENEYVEKIANLEKEYIEKLTKFENENTLLQEMINANNGKDEKVSLVEAEKTKSEQLSKLVFELQEKNDSLAKNTNTSYEQIEELKKQLLETGAIVVQLTEEKTSLSELLLSGKAQQDELQNLIKLSQVEVAQMKNDSKELAEKLLYSDEQILELQSALRKAEQCQSEMKSSVDEICAANEKERQQLLREIEKLKQDLDNSTTSNVQLENIHIELKKAEEECNSLRAMQKHNAEQIERLSNENTTLHERLMKLDSELVLNNSKIEMMENELKIKQEHARELESALQKMQEELFISKNSELKYETELREMQSSDKKLIAIIEALKIEINEVKTNASIDIERITEDKRQSNVLNQTASDKILLLEEELTQLKSADGKLKEECISVKHNVEVLEAQLREVESNFLLEKNKTISLQSSLEDKEAENRSIDRQLNELKVAHNNLEIQFQEMQKLVAEEKLQQSTANSSELGGLQKQLREHEDRENKLKQLALKAKKEASEMKSKLESLTEELNNVKKQKQELETGMETAKKDALSEASSLAQKYHLLLVEHDRVQKDADEHKEERKKLEKNLNAVVADKAALTEALAEMKEAKELLNKQLDTVESEKKATENAKKAVEKEKEVERMQKEEALKKRKDLETQLAAVETRLQSIQTAHMEDIKRLTDKLKNAENEAKLAQKENEHRSLVDLEIADYERSIKSLSEQRLQLEQQVAEQREEIGHKEEKIVSLGKQLESAETQYVQAEDRANKLKQMVVKTKKELSDVRKIEIDLQSLLTQTRAQLEKMTQELEEHKIQISGLAAENQKLNDRLRSLTENHSRSSRSLEMQLKTTEQQLEMSKTELENLQAEFNAYKVRVQSVMRQQKLRTHDSVTLEQERQEKQRMEAMAEQWKQKLQETSEKMRDCVAEKDALQEEFEQLQQRYNHLATELDVKEKAWKEKYDRLASEKASGNIGHMETVRQLTLQNESVAKTLMDQMRQMQDDHRRTVELLHQQLEQRRQAELAMEVKKEVGVVEKVYNSDLRAEERQDGEGMETVDSQTASKVIIPRYTSPLNLSVNNSTTASNFISFEQLLNNELNNGSNSVKLQDSDLALLQEKQEMTEKNVAHLTELLNESEANVMHLTEQARVLKEEIRRLERNQERESSVSNMEYLKNIIMKFLTLGGGSERQQLVPVLQTMLKLSPEEKDIVSAIASSNAASPLPRNQADREDVKGWGGYLQRLSGIL